MIGLLLKEVPSVLHHPRYKKKKDLHINWAGGVPDESCTGNFNYSSSKRRRALY